MTNDNLEQSIENAWERRDTITPGSEGSVRDSVGTALNGLDSGRYRVAEPSGSGWFVHQWLKKAVLLSFRLTDMRPI